MPVKTWHYVHYVHYATFNCNCNCIRGNIIIVIIVIINALKAFVEKLGP